MKLEHGMERSRARVEMIPLIDCVFILLVFFIYSMLAMTLQRGITVQLPQARSLQPSQEEAVVITITAEGTFLVDRETVSLEGLGAAVNNALAGAADPRIAINADAGSEHRWFVHAVDELRLFGYDQIMILSQEPDHP